MTRPSRCATLPVNEQRRPHGDDATDYPRKSRTAARSGREPRRARPLTEVAFGEDANARPGSCRERRRHRSLTRGCLRLLRRPDTRAEWNPKARRVEQVTAGPIGLGTRYEAEFLKGNTTTIEFVRFEHPV